MVQFKKYLPFILAAVGLLTLYLNYDQWKMMKKEDCNCGKEEQIPPLGAIN